ncbi:MAG TPA: LuxR C-terminal-related transcriptional regulator [Patescibacteria group bacterium]|nr:LuxR C-terminal-related transcriptional regulator [Patescibacteria group bacterium]
MSFGILNTKLSIPPVNTHIVSRGHLNDLLKNALKYKLVLVSSPAGSGKTTIITDYINRNSIECLWYSLDKTDNDVFRFSTYLIRGLEKNGELRDVNLSELLDSFHIIGELEFIRAVVNALQSTTHDYTLVFDDYHLIELPAVQNMMKQLLLHLPPNIHIIIITREDPLLPLSRLRVRNQLLEIRIEQLKFSDSEANSFLNKSMKLDLSEKGVQVLNKRAEGWIAGLQLAALYIRGHQDKEQFVMDFSGNHYYIMDYLLEEVLKQQSSEAQKFLMCTSILNQFNGSLCDEIFKVEKGTSQAIIEALLQANVFIVPLDYQHTWFRYHHLFRDLLYQKLLDTSIDINELHMTASHWYTNDGNIIEAVRHALSAEDINYAAELIEGVWAEMDQSLQGGQWLNLAKQLPNDVIRRRPVLNVGYAWALIDSGDIENAVERLEETKEIVESIRSNDSMSNYIIYDREQFDLLRVTIASAFAYIAAAKGEFKKVLYYANEALPQIPEDKRHKKGVIQMLLGLSYWANGDMNTALDVVNQGVLNIVKEGSPLSLSTFQLVVAELKIETGHFQEAITIINHSIAMLKEEEKLPLALASLYMKLSEIYFLKGSYEKSNDLLNLSREKSRKFALPDFHYKWYIMQARLLASSGQYTAALESLAEARNCYYVNPIPEHISIDGLSADINLKMGKPENSNCFFHQKDFETEQDKLIYVKYLLYEYLKISDKSKINAASVIVAELYEQALRQDRKRSIIDLLVFKAIIANVKSDKQLALQYTRDAMNLALDEAYVFPFAHNKEYLEDIYRELYRKNELPKSMELLIIDSIKGCSNTDVNDALIEPLSLRELEVLQLLSQGYSNQEICDKLFLALSTVKGYNRTIFGKLDVKRRTEAIIKAREIGLLN